MEQVRYGYRVEGFDEWNQTKRFLVDIFRPNHAGRYREKVLEIEWRKSGASFPWQRPTVTYEGNNISIALHVLQFIFRVEKNMGKEEKIPYRDHMPLRFASPKDFLHALQNTRPFPALLIHDKRVMRNVLYEDVLPQDVSGYMNRCSVTGNALFWAFGRDMKEAREDVRTKFVEKITSGETRAWRGGNTYQKEFEIWENSGEPIELLPQGDTPPKFLSPLDALNEIEEQ